MIYNAILTIKKNVIVKNYKTIRKQVGKVPIAIMLKANAYGCGINKIFGLLYKEGARDFFVANLSEALQLKESINTRDANIYVLHDIAKENYKIYLKNKFIPVLNTCANIYLWAEKGERMPCLIHFDSGLNRLGLTLQDSRCLKEDGILDKLNIKYVISHFACSQNDDQTYTLKQQKNFEQVMRLFPEGTKFSIADSSAIFKNKKYHLDMVRTGSALYGINPTNLSSNPMKNAIEIKARVIQIKDVKKGDSIGYDQKYIMPKDGKIAIIGVGYADSIMRSHMNSGAFYFNGKKLPILGVISMDLTTVDITRLKTKIKENDLVEVIGDNQDLDTFGASGKTSGYEILTSLSDRYIWKFK
ncbi:MAG: alanine racemase [Alphaproteobacteria bacterium]|nr:alanine racemase [Alphaproteobacteria bacterium]